MAICECGDLSKPLKVTRDDEVPRCGRCYSPLIDPEVFARELEELQAQEALAADQLQARLREFVLVTTDLIPGYEIVELIGSVHATASTVNQGTEDKKGIWNTQEKRMSWAVEQATLRIVEKAADLGANAVIGAHVAVNESEGGVSSWRSTGAVVMGTAVVANKRDVAPHS